MTIIRILPALAFLMAAVLLPYLHMGGIVCPHHGREPESSQHRHSCNIEFMSSSYVDASGESNDEGGCPVCLFLAYFNADAGFSCLPTFPHKVNSAHVKHLTGILFSKTVDLSNPPTAPPFPS